MPALAAVGAIAGIASAGVGIAGAAGAFNPDAPTPLNYGQISRDAQQAQIDLLPAKYAAQATYDPKFAATQSQIQYQNLFGAPAGSHNVTNQTFKNGWRNSTTGEISATDKAPFFNTAPNGIGRKIANPWVPYQIPTSTTTTVQDPSVPGMLQTLQQALPSINDLAANANTTSRTATINDVAKLGPQALAALKGYDPQSTTVLDKLAGQASDELAAGTQLTPSESREVSQGIRASQSARGLGYGNTDVFTEAMGLGQAGENRLLQRQNFAANVVNQRSQTYGDPFLAIAGQQSGRNTSPTQFYTPPAPSALDTGGSSPYNLAALNQNYANQASIAGYNQQQASLGGLMNTNWSSVFGKVGSLFPSGGNTNPNLLPTYGAGGAAY